MTSLRPATIVLACVAALAACPGAAQDYPARVVRIVVPYPPGGGVDGIARVIADRLTARFGQSVIVENKSGAATMIGGAYVARAAADGYTLLLTSDSSITSNPFLFKTMTYDPVKDLVPVSQLIDLHQMVVTHPSVPARSLGDLVTYVKTRPQGVNYGSYGNGSQPNLLFETLKAKTGAQFMQVPFRGIAPAILATLSNDVQMTLGGPATTGDHVRTGKLKALAVGRKERLKSFPEVETLAEAGFADADPRSWFGVLAPAATPTDIVKKISGAIAAVLAEPDIKERYIDANGYTGIGNTPEEFAAFIKDDLAYKEAMIRRAGITPE